MTDEEIKKEQKRRCFDLIDESDYVGNDWNQCGRCLTCIYTMPLTVFRVWLENENGK